jgi:hypothetical protein
VADAVGPQTEQNTFEKAKNSQLRRLSANQAAEPLFANFDAMLRGVPGVPW